MKTRLWDERLPFYYVVGLMCCVFCTGCFVLTNAFIKPDTTSLEFLKDGETTKETVILRLGSSFVTFEEQRILSYRLGKTREGYFALARSGQPASRLAVNEPAGPGWLSGLEGKWNLILVFDEMGILRKHALKPID